jgi:hypothetical protein
MQGPSHRRSGSCLTSVEERAAILTPSLALDIGPSLIAVRVRIAVLSAPFDKNMSLLKIVSTQMMSCSIKAEGTYLKSIFP